MTAPGLLIVISGPGGVGKDTLIAELLRRDPRLRFAISYTTRPRRDYEVDGVDYAFVDESEFRRLLAAGEMVEHEQVNGYLYGTSRSRVEEAQERGCDIVLKPEVRGAEQIRRQRPDGLFIFLAPPSMEELMRRRRHRGSESEEVMEARQRLAELEMSFANRYDHVVVNDTLERAVEATASIIEQRRHGG